MFRNLFVAAAVAVLFIPVAPAVYAAQTSQNDLAGPTALNGTYSYNPTTGIQSYPGGGFSMPGSSFIVNAPNFGTGATHGLCDGSRTPNSPSSKPAIGGT